MTYLSKYKFHLLLIACSVAITGYYYYPALNNYFAWDDYWMLLVTGGDVKTVFFGFLNLRLVGNGIVWLNHQALGFNHVGYNALSIAVHMLNVVLLFLFMKKLTDNDKLSFVTAAVYASLSVYADAILYKAAIQTLANLTFYLFTLLLYMKGRSNKKFYYYSILVFLCGMLTKEEIASIPILIVFMEIVIYDNFQEIRQILKKTVPYVVIIVTYIITSYVLNKFDILYQEQFERLSKFRPLHSLFGGFTSYFAKPDGVLDQRHILVASLLMIVIIPAALYFSRNRKMFIFGLGWTFITFLPQSYSNLTQYSPRHLFASISRHLYIPTVGTAIVIAVIVLFTVKQGYKHIVNASAVACLLLLLFINAPRVHFRSTVWGNSADEMHRFLFYLTRAYPVFPEGTRIIVDFPPTGRAYMTRALSAFYGCNVYYVDDPSKLDISSVTSLYEIKNYLNYGFLKIDRIK